jgi:DNA-binding transcriptional ArsR family regulator
MYITKKLNNRKVEYEVTMTTADTLDKTFAALADPTRRAIIARLSTGQATVTELAAPFAMSLPAVSKHLKVLERAGLVARGRRAQWRPAQLQAEPLHEVADWLADYRRFWEERLDRFDEYLHAIQGSEPEEGAAKVEEATKADEKATRKEGEQ